MNKAALLFVLSLSGLALQTPANASPAEPKTVEAVRAADDAWGAAEARGDAAFVAWLLLPGYESVGSAGKAISRDAIVAGAKARAASPVALAKMAGTIASWKAEHPVRADVTIHGDTAVLTWVSLKPESGNPISSSDIFVYRQGHWHAIYSQHSAASA